MPLNRRHAIAGLTLFGAGAATWFGWSWAGARRAERLYAMPLTKPAGPMQVFHLGHSLVGRDMPAMVAQLAGYGHGYHSQLGWGASLKEHWEPDLPIKGFTEENDHLQFRPAKAAMKTGAYDAIVLTEMVEIRDAIRYHDSGKYLARWAGLAWHANPNARIYLYETWHHTDDNESWLVRLDEDLRKYWLGRVMYPAVGHTDAPIHLIPAGQVIAAFVRKVETAGGIGGISRRENLFDDRADGTVDTIHFNDLGAYLVALTHYAVLYHTSPVGLPYQLLHADGTPATAPSQETATAMQETVWDIIRQHPETGVAA